MIADHPRPGEPDYWQTLLKQIAAMWWTPLDYTAQDFQKIVVPALILLGDRDGIIELQQAVDMYQLIPDAELFVLPNTTHFTTVNELSTSLVCDFLIRHSTRNDQV